MYVRQRYTLIYYNRLINLKEWLVYSNLIRKFQICDTDFFQSSFEKHTLKMKYFFCFLYIATLYVSEKTIANENTSEKTTTTNLTSVFNSCGLTSLYKAARKQGTYDVKLPSAQYFRS
jgi:hypothetical protein